MDALDTKLAVDAVCRMALQIPLNLATGLVAEIERTEAFMPFTAPTRYMEIRNTLPGHLAVAKAFLVFRDELERCTRPAVARG